jgi:hypothetical protein
MRRTHYPGETQGPIHDSGELHVPDTDIDTDGQPTTSGWSRRTVLKGAAAGTALWAIPSVTTLGARASAASSQPCGPLDCNNIVPCGASGDCLCAAHEGGGSGCSTGGVCEPNGNICSTDADCVAQFGAGSQCLDFVPNGSCDGGQCPGATTFCSFPCPDGSGVHKAGGRKPAARRGQVLVARKR